MADDERDPASPEPAGDAEEDLVGPYWAIMRRMAGPRPPVEETAPERVGRTYPGELVIASGRGGAIVRIQRDGSIVYGEGYTPDEAAVQLWTAIGRQRPHFEERMRYMDLLELHIALLCVADEAYEAAQRAAHVDGASANDHQREELSRHSLEMRVHGLIEFAREFAPLRPDLMAMARRVASGT
jgi:hypothetical protein